MSVPFQKPFQSSVSVVSPAWALDIDQSWILVVVYPMVLQYLSKLHAYGCCQLSTREIVFLSSMTFASTQSSLSSPSSSLTLREYARNTDVQSKYLLNWTKLKFTIVRANRGTLLYALLVSSTCLYTCASQKSAVVVGGHKFFLGFTDNIPFK